MVARGGFELAQPVRKEISMAVGLHTKIHHEAPIIEFSAILFEAG